MSKFHPLRIEAKVFETSQCVSLTFDIPESLKNEYTFTPGQYLTLRSWIREEEVRRSYSICTEPSEGLLKVAVKKVPNGLFSTYAMDELEVGMTLDVAPAEGNFVHKKGSNGGRYVFFAAGSGITPVLSLIKSLLLTEPQSDLILFYGNKSTDQIIFREEIEALKNAHLQRLSVHYFFSQESQEIGFYNGRIDSGKMKTICEDLIGADQISEFFLCGPEIMIWTVKEALEAQSVDPERIRFELFNTSQPSGSTDFVGTLDTEEVDHSSRITIIVDGMETEFDLPYKGKTILDAALEVGGDLPFSCKGGVCCTCKAKILEGQVEMELNYALEQDEIDVGYVLTCQSHPRSAVVKVDYDV